MADMLGDGGLSNLLSGMNMDPSKMQQMNEEAEAKADLNISKHISELDEELRDRFKALKVIQNLMHDLNEEEQKEVRKQEIIFEEKYREIYDLRRMYINADKNVDAQMSQDLIKQFDERAEQMKDKDYEELQITPCDVKQIQNSPSGVSDFWLRAMLNHSIGSMVSDKDRAILGYLQNIELELHSEEKGHGYDLIFRFEPNSYFEGTEIKKEFHMKHKGMMDRTVSTQIKWKDNCDPTIMKKKKKKKGKKVNVTVKCRSFFNFFKDRDPNADDEDDDDEEEEDDMDDQQEIGDQIKDDLVPLGLEYYLGVIDIEDEEESDEDGDSDGGKKDGGSDDDDEGAKKKKKKKKGGPQLPPGADPKDCKQQ